MKRAVIMSRVSSEEQAKGFSLGVQFEQLTNYCKRKDIEIVAHYKEDHSAKNFNRPEFQNFLRFAKKNKKTIDYLLVTTWDRFSRNVTDSFLMIRQLKEMGIEVQAIEQPIDFSIPESKAMLAINLVFPEIDNDRRSIKIRGGIRGSLKAGRWCRMAPVGDTEMNLSLITASTLSKIFESFKTSRYQEFPHVLFRDIVINEERILKALSK